MSYSELDSYLTVSHLTASSQITVKGSRFIAQVFHVQDQRQADKRYLDICKVFHDATHNCFAYRIDKSDFRYSDNGEPSGTAGYPIFKILEGHSLFQTLIVVTRYFGGKKLGPGGLMRAYSEVTRSALAKAKILKKINYTSMDIKTDYVHLASLKNLVKKYHGVMKSPRYAEYVHIHINIPSSKIESFHYELKKFIHYGVKIIKP